MPAITRAELAAARRRTAQPKREPGATSPQRTSPRRLAPPARRESEIQKAVLAHLALVPGVVAFRMNTGAFSGEYKGRRRFVRFGKRGLSDIIGWRHEDMGVDDQGNWCSVSVARFLAIEIKKPGKPPTPEQAAFLAQVKAAGGLAFVATSVDDVVKELGT